MLLLVPVFALPGKILPLRVLAAVLILLNAATAAGIFRLASRSLLRGAAWLTGLAFALLAPIHDFTARGGLEAGLSIFLIVLMLDRLAAARPRALRDTLGVSLLACLVLLARLDNVFLAGFTGLALLARHWRLEEGTVSPWPGRFRQAVWFYGPLALTLAAYMLWSQLGFGTPTPVSGQVKQWWGTLPNSVYGFPPDRFVNFIGQFVTNDPDIGPWSLATRPLYAAAEALSGDDLSARRVALAALGGAAAVGIAGLAWLDRSRLPRTVWDLGLVPLLLGCLAQIAYYRLTGSVGSRPWYWAPENLWLVLAGGALAGAFWRTVIARRMAPGSAQTRLGWAVAAAGAVLLFAPHTNRLNRIISPELASEQRFYLQRARWLEANTEEGSLIGMTGTGSSAYFTDGRGFVNLDGLINSYEYFQHMQDGTAAGYLDRIGLDYVFGADYIITESDPYGGIFAGRLQAEAAFQAEGRALILWRFIGP